MKILPNNAQERKKYPMYSGLLNYFPDALAMVAKCSYDGNQQHHPDKPLHWDKSKSYDELDALVRHICEGEWEKVAWRALANLQRKIDDGYGMETGEVVCEPYVWDSESVGYIITCDGFNLWLQNEKKYIVKGDLLRIGGRWDVGMQDMYKEYLASKAGND